VFLALGLAAVLLSERPGNGRGPSLPALLTGGIASAGLLAYLLAKQTTFGLIWGGVLPLSVLLIVTVKARITWGAAGRTVALVFAGFILAGLPLAVLAASQGAFTAWIGDMLFTALMINGQEFISESSYRTLLILAAQILLQGGGPAATVSAMAWILLVLSVPALAALVAFDLMRNWPVHPAALLAVFWSVSALHYQIPIYLLFVLPSTLLALILMRPATPIAGAVVALCLWALVFQAGQPLERGLAGVVAGVRAPPNVRSTLPRVSLQIQAADDEIFRQLLSVIESGAAPQERLMTLPMEPEVNFMTARPSPVPYFATPLGLREDSDVTAAVEALNGSAPLFVVHRRVDKYLTPLSAELLSRVQAGSGPPQQIGPFDVYRYEGEPVPPG
jgi:hypothetical protein